MMGDLRKSWRDRETERGGGDSERKRKREMKTEGQREKRKRARQGSNPRRESEVGELGVGGLGWGAAVIVGVLRSQ